MPSDYNSLQLINNTTELNKFKLAFADLEKRYEKQVMILEAMFEIIKVKTETTETELLQEVAKIIKRKSRSTSQDCEKCGRPLREKKFKCMYCGEERRPESSFELLVKS
jgi:predicted Zn-ribbon and HTH transcriptional regulator